MAVVESLRLTRVQFEVLAGNPPESQVGLEVRAHVRDEGSGRASVLLVARFFDGHPKPPFRLELAVEGLFRLDPGESADALAKGAGPAALFPYLKDEVGVLTLRAGLAPVVLPPLAVAPPVSTREGLN